MANPAANNDYSHKIKLVRSRLGLTQVALAKELGVSLLTVNRWETGKSKPSQLSWNQLEKLNTGKLSDRVAEPEALPYAEARPKIDFTAEPETVRSLVEGERLSFGHLANPTFATEIANIDPLPHQRIAVYDHMLRQPRLRFLLADDAGAGKTIMTGLYLREMLSRRLLKRVLIVPPAGLVGNWHRELSTLFSLQFKIISGADARDQNPFTGPSSNRIIVSVDTLAGERALSRLRQKDTEPYDLVVFDEAHKLSCDRGNDLRVRKTDRYRLAEAIAGAHSVDSDWHLGWHAHHLLLLTATPHMGKDYPYFALWRLLEPDVFGAIESFEEYPVEKRKDYFIRRTKEEMIKFNGEPLYPKRIADTLAYELTQGEVSEQRLYDETTEYLRHVYNNAKILNQSAARLAMGVFQRRLASSTYALLRSFQRRIEKLNKIIDDVQAGRITIDQLLMLQRRIDEDDDVLENKGADEESTENGMEENEIAEDKLLAGVIGESIGALIAEREQVKQLLALAHRVHDSGHESKLDKLREVVTDSKFSGEKLIVFTEHRDTLNFIVRRLGGMGYTGQIATIHGGMPYTERQDQIERFRKATADGGARFMICTDAAAEGINLQFCWIMINYDVPWNPARLEQRMGRIHRYKQQHDPVIILNLVAPSTREGRVLKTLLDKLEKIRKQLKSDKVYDCIGRVFSGVSIKSYMEMALTGDGDEVARQLDGQLTKEQIQAIEERERKIFGDGGDVKKELPRLRQNVEQETFFRLLPGYVRRYMESAAPLVGIAIEGDLGRDFTLRPSSEGAVDSLLPALESYPVRQRGSLSIVRSAENESSVWIHPGEPVFESFREIVRKRLGKAALRGAVFVDPTASKPYLFHLARLTVVRKADPEIDELSQEETVECRLVGIRQSEGAEISECPVEHLLLLRGGYGLPSQAQRLALIAEQQREVPQAYLTERVARSMAVTRRSRLLDSLTERESFIRRGFDYQEAELAESRAKLSPKARDGNPAAAKRLTEIKEQQRVLSQRRDLSLAILKREPELIVPGEVAFIAHALVVPSVEQDDLEIHQSNVEQTAMDLVRAYEEAAGGKVKLVHTPELARMANLPDHPGFDILSMRPGAERRCIEIKGLAGLGEIQVTDNEWARACNLRQEYWLYVVYNCATPSPQMVRVQDPFEKLLVRPFKKLQVVESIREVGGVRIGHLQMMEVGEV